MCISSLKAELEISGLPYQGESKWAGYDFFQWETPGLSDGWKRLGPHQATSLNESFDCGCFKAAELTIFRKGRDSLYSGGCARDWDPTPELPKPGGPCCPRPVVREFTGHEWVTILGTGDQEEGRCWEKLSPRNCLWLLGITRHKTKSIFNYRYAHSQTEVWSGKTWTVLPGWG